MKFSKIIALIATFCLIVCTLTGCLEKTKENEDEANNDSANQSTTSDSTGNEPESIDAGGNNDKNEQSNVEPIKYSTGLTFELDEETNTYIVKDLGSCRDSTLVIPPSFEGKAVTAIGDNFFRNYFTYPDIPNIQKVIISEGIHTIGDTAFKDCSTIKEIELPSSISDIGFEAFTNCTLLENITINGSNEKYKSIDGVLYSNYGKTLKHYPAGRESRAFTVPDGVQIIGYDAFDGCVYLEHIILPQTIVKLNNASFANCIGLNRLEIPKNISQISWEVFYGCKNLTIEYSGSTTEWEAINKDARWNSGAKIAHIICDNGEVS